MTRKPSLFVAGAAKCGTSSLGYYLAQHPQICWADESRAIEPSYFADGAGVDDLDDYLSLFSPTSAHTVLGEKSTAYLFDAQSAQRLHDFEPESRIVILLRDPVDMAYSLFRHNRREGVEPLSEFDDALFQEEQRFLDPTFRKRTHGYYANFLYRRRALYFPQVMRFYDVFPEDQILMLSFSELKADAMGTCRKVFEFAGVDEQFEPELAKQNQGQSIRVGLLHDLYFGSAAVRGVVKRLLPDPIRRRVRRWNMSTGYTPLSDGERARFSQLFADDQQLMQRQFGRSFV